MIRWWPWRRHRGRPAQSPNTSIAAARTVRKRVEHIQRAARDQQAEVAEMATTLRRIREENHLLEIFQASLRDRGE